MHWSKLNANLNLIAFLWQYVSNRDNDIGLCVSYLGLFVFETVSTVVKDLFQNVDLQYVRYLIHTFCVYVSVLCGLGSAVLLLDTSLCHSS